MHCLSSMSQTNSFQAVLVTDGTRSYSLFIYHCDLLQTGGAAIGFAASGNFLFNHRSSLGSDSSGVACSNRPHSDWNALLYPIHYDGKKRIRFYEFNSASFCCRKSLHPLVCITNNFKVNPSQGFSIFLSFVALNNLINITLYYLRFVLETSKIILYPAN